MSKDGRLPCGFLSYSRVASCAHFQCQCNSCCCCCCCGNPLSEDTAGARFCIVDNQSRNKGAGALRRFLARGAFGGQTVAQRKQQTSKGQNEPGPAVWCAGRCPSSTPREKVREVVPGCMDYWGTFSACPPLPGMLGPGQLVCKAFGLQHYCAYSTGVARARLRHSPCED